MEEHSDQECSLPWASAVPAQAALAVPVTCSRASAVPLQCHAEGPKNELQNPRSFQPLWEAEAEQFLSTELLGHEVTGQGLCQPEQGQFPFQINICLQKGSSLSP